MKIRMDVFQKAIIMTIMRCSHITLGTDPWEATSAKMNIAHMLTMIGQINSQVIEFT